MQLGQTKHHSRLEIASSTVVGYIVAIMSQEYLFPKYGVHISIWASMGMGAWFTVISVVRGYVFRRLFNWWQVKSQKDL